MTLRLDGRQAAELDAVCAADGCSAAEVIRSALARYVEARLADPRFRAALAAHIGLMRQLLGDEGRLVG